jgi:hypothetical protein
MQSGHPFGSHGYLIHVFYTAKRQHLMNHIFCELLFVVSLAGIFLEKFTPFKL